MIINQNSQLTTHGPSRTEIRQQPKEETKGRNEVFAVSRFVASTLAEAMISQTAPAASPIAFAVCGKGGNRF